MRWLAGYTGYYLDTLRPIGMKDSLAVLKSARGQKLSKGMINVEPTTRHHIDRNGTVYSFECNTLDIIKASKLQQLK
jgi:hypothetical protein